MGELTVAAGIEVISQASQAEGRVSRAGAGKARKALHAVLLGGVSVIAFGAVLARSPAAQAQTTTISTSSNQTVYTTNNNNIIVNKNVDLTASPGIDEYSFSNVGTIANQGTLLGVYTGIATNGVLGTLTNAGIIIESAGKGTYNTGTINQFSNSTGATISGGSVDVYNPGTIGTLTNAGMISGGDSAIMDPGDIGLLDNNAGGIITGGLTGVSNHGTIGTLSNSGLINGSDAGVYNINFINMLSNANGATISSGSTGVYNTGTIGTLTNAGTISAGETGIDNFGTINLLNNGTGAAISGVSTGIYSAGTIGTLTNSGTIIGGDAGIGIFGAIQTLTNAGVINSSNGAGIFNDGYVGTLVNTGLITGREVGLDDAFGTIGAIDNGAGGTITRVNSGLSAIVISNNFGTLTNSGLINGNILFDARQDLNIAGGSGAQFGTLTGGTISVVDGYNVNFLSGNEILTDNISALSSGGRTTGAIGALTNSGTLQIGTAGTPATVNIDGNFTQSSAGTLRVIVTPSASSQLAVSGTANLAGGVDYVLAPGTYTPKTYSYLTAGTINGSFTSATYEGVPSGDATTTYSPDPSANLVLNSGFMVAASQVIAPSDSSIFSAQTQALAQATQQVDASLLGIAAVGGAAASPACQSQAPLGNAANGQGAANIASAIAAGLCNAGGWIEADGSLGHVGGAGGAAAYNANTAGFLAGIDRVFGPAGTRLGIAVGYDETYLSDKSGGSGDMGTTRLALYGAQPVGALTLSGVLGYGYAGNNTKRGTDVGSIKETNNLNILSAALQASTVVTLPGFEVIPAAGIRYVNVGAAHVSESASGLDGAFALTGRTRSFNSLQPYATAELTNSFATMSGYSIAPEATLGVQDEAANRGAASNLTAADGTPFISTHNTLDPLAAILGAGVSASKNNLTLYINYNGLVSGNWNTQAGEAGLRITF